MQSQSYIDNVLEIDYIGFPRHYKETERNEYYKFPRELVAVSFSLANSFGDAPSESSIYTIVKDKNTNEEFVATATNFSVPAEESDRYEIYKVFDANFIFYGVESTKRSGALSLLYHWLTMYTKGYTVNGEKVEGIGFPCKYVLDESENFPCVHVAGEPTRYESSTPNFPVTRETDLLKFEYREASQLVNSIGLTQIGDPTRYGRIYGSENMVMDAVKRQISESEELQESDKNDDYKKLSEAARLFNISKTGFRNIYMNIPDPVVALFDSVSETPEGILDLVDLANISDRLGIELLKEQLLGYMKLKTKGLTGPEMKRLGWITDSRPAGYIPNWPYPESILPPQVSVGAGIGPGPSSAGPGPSRAR